MAVSVQAPFFSKPSMWHLGDSPATFSSDPEAMSGPMAYPYPPNQLDSSSMIPTYHQPHGHQESLSPATDNRPLSPGQQRLASSNNKAAKIKRSMSTPNVRAQSSVDASNMALSADKRRNKLGYHRTSVACGHCRRRKIRCIPAPADPQNRCSNCIRLKKECNFFPVDQQPPPEPRRKGSKAQSGTGGASEASSPSTATGPVPDLPTTVPFPPTLNMPPIQDLGGPQMKRQRTESFSPETKVVTTSRNYGFSHNLPNWMAPDTSPNSKGPADVPQNYWRNTNDSPMTPAFSPFTPNTMSMQPSQQWPAHHHPEPSPRDDLAWSIPQRSMSYNNLDNLQNQHQYGPFNQHPPHTGDNYMTKPRGLQSMYHPPIATVEATLPSNGPPSGQEPTQTSQAGGNLPSFPTWQQSYNYSKGGHSGTESYQNWSTPHAPIPVPLEATLPSHQPYQYNDQQPSTFYSAPHHER